MRSIRVLAVDTALAAPRSVQVLPQQQQKGRSHATVEGCAARSTELAIAVTLVTTAPHATSRVQVEQQQHLATDAVRVTV